MQVVLQSLLKKEKDKLMKKLVIITSGTYPSQGVLNLIKYISYCLINDRNFKKNMI